MVTTQSQSPAVVKFNMFYKPVIFWKQGLHQRIENCQIYKFYKYKLADLYQKSCLELLFLG